MTLSYIVRIDRGIRSWACSVLVSGFTVASSAEATSQVGVVMAASSASLIRPFCTTPQMGTAEANSRGYSTVIFMVMYPPLLQPTTWIWSRSTG